MTRLAVLTALSFFLAFSAEAADLPKDMSLAPTHLTYYATRDAFMRALPDNNSARIGGVAKGQRVNVAGKVVIAKSKGPHWLAIKRPNGEMGYVFGTALVPMIDGTLKAPLQGKVSNPGRPDCRFIVAFEGRTKVPDEIQQTADYDVAFECAGKTAEMPIAFTAGMFITELPFADQRELFQINIDLWDIRVNDEDALSVTALYDPLARTVSFDRVNDERFGSGKGLSPESAPDVPGALTGAIRLAHKVFQSVVWDQLAPPDNPVAEPEAKSDKGGGPSAD